MTLYSLNKTYPITSLPERIRLSNSLTRTDSSTYTNEEIADAGYVAVNDKPEETDILNYKLIWNGDDWEFVERTVEEKQDQHSSALNSITIQRNKLIEEIEWRIMRYHSYERQDKTQIDDISTIDEYIQALRDCINKEDPTATELPSIDLPL